MTNCQLESIRKIRKNKDNLNPHDYSSLKQYAMDCIEFGISSQKYGDGAEKIAQILCGFTKEVAEDKGDFVGGIEFKFSIANNDGKINFVQLRPSYKIDYYMLSFYDPCLEGDDLFETIICRSEDLYALLPEYGGYAHGTVAENGVITEQNIKNNLSNGCEYALRPNTRGGNNKGARLLEELRKINLIEEVKWTTVKNNLV